MITMYQGEVRALSLPCSNPVSGVVLTASQISIWATQELEGDRSTHLASLLRSVCLVVPPDRHSPIRSGTNPRGCVAGELRVKSADSLMEDDLQAGEANHAAGDDKGPKDVNLNVSHSDISSQALSLLSPPVSVLPQRRRQGSQEVLEPKAHSHRDTRACDSFRSQHPVIQSFLHDRSTC